MGRGKKTEGLVAVLFMYGNQDSRSKALNRRMKPTAGSILGWDWAVAMIPCFDLESLISSSCGMSQGADLGRIHYLHDHQEQA